jgi:hypothetical protein
VFPRACLAQQSNTMVTMVTMYSLTPNVSARILKNMMPSRPLAAAYAHGDKAGP